MLLHLLSQLQREKFGSDDTWLCRSDFHGKLLILYVGAVCESVDLLNAYENITDEMGCPLIINNNYAIASQFLCMHI